MTYKKGTRVELTEDYEGITFSHIPKGELSLFSESKPIIIPKGTRGIADDEWYNLNAELGNGSGYTDVQFEEYGAQNVPDTKLEVLSDPIILETEVKTDQTWSHWKKWLHIFNIPRGNS